VPFELPLLQNLPLPGTWPATQRTSHSSRSPRQTFSALRSPPRQHVQQALPGPPGPVPVEISADDTGGNDPAANVGAISHLQNVVVEPRHVGASRHYQSFQTNPRVAWRETVA